jgi:hypothetical protein
MRYEYAYVTQNARGQTLFDDNQIYCYFRAVTCGVLGFPEAPLTGFERRVEILSTRQRVQSVLLIFKPYKFSTRSEIIVMHILNNSNRIL